MSNPDLQDALAQLDQELEEGDITRKGYEKRRTLILSHYGAPPRAPQRGLRLHNPDDSDHPVAVDGSRSASLAALTATSSVSSTTMVSPDPPGMVRQITTVKDGFGGQGSMRSNSPGGLVQRFHERDAGGLRPQKSFDNRRDTLTIDSSAGSRSQTLMSQNYAFNPESQGEVYGNGGDTRHSTMLDSQQGYFSDFAGQQRQDTQEEYGGRMQRYSQGDRT